MYQEERIYSKAKEDLRKYWRIARNNVNEKVIYESAMILYLIRQEYREDTRVYNIEQSTYEEERAKIVQLQNKIRENEECNKEAIDACKDALEYIELVVGPRTNLRIFA